MRGRWNFVAACVAIATAAPSLADAQAQRAQGFVGRAWLSTDAAAAPGTLRIFLADGTLLMDSCGETYRLAKWRTLGSRRIEWTEDGARIEAEVSQQRAGELRLRLRLRSETRDERYRLATVPFVCPDSRSGPALAAVSVSGRVFFLERLALPPAAIVRVELRDTSRLDAPSRTLAAHAIPATQGPPFTFALSVPAAAVDPGGSLSLFAEIRDAERLMFTTDARHPVPHAGASGMEVRLRFVASGAGDRAPGVVTPTPATYRCGTETFRVAFEEGQAYVTLADGSLVTLQRLNAGSPGGDARRYSDGRLTFVEEGGGPAPRVSFASGRMAFTPCTRQRD